MDRQNDWRESDCTFFDATCTSDNEWNIDAPPRDDHTASDARPSPREGRVMVIGFSVIRV
jgi:hypothetical protein